MVGRLGCSHVFNKCSYLPPPTKNHLTMGTEHIRGKTGYFTNFLVKGVGVFRVQLCHFFLGGGGEFFPTMTTGMKDLRGFRWRLFQLKRWKTLPPLKPEIAIFEAGDTFSKVHHFVVSMLDFGSIHEMVVW